MLIDKSQLIVRELAMEELDPYLEFIKYVKAHMEHPEWLGEFTREDYVWMLNNGSHIYIWTLFENINRVFTDINQFVACGMIIPARQKDLEKFLQTDLKFEEVADFGPEAVHPNYIGNGLQSDVIQFLEKEAVKKGFMHGLGTVDPDNIYSIRNLIQNGFKVVTRVELKRGTRDVLRKDNM
ncbi:MAG: hypothetical protein IKI57_07080 [Clostridia bacterium]|nr:hypothetical protein [Clostridia bacterium]